MVPLGMWISSRRDIDMAAEEDTKIRKIYLLRTTKMKTEKILLLFLCLGAVTLAVIGDASTCPANLESKYSDSVEWKGEFFPDIPEIKYEVFPISVLPARTH